MTVIDPTAGPDPDRQTWHRHRAVSPAQWFAVAPAQWFAVSPAH